MKLQDVLLKAMAKTITWWRRRACTAKPGCVPRGQAYLKARTVFQEQHRRYSLEELEQNPPCR